MTTYRKPKISELIKFDKEIAQNAFIIGTDEAGRGPIAGPVVASAVYFPEFNRATKKALKFLDDSKKFSSNSALRKELSESIKAIAIYSIQEATVEEIEKYNILQASLLAMKKACNEVIIQVQSEIEPQILVDGRIRIPAYNYQQNTIIKGDSKSASIAAASILAKVHRDELMIKLAEEFPHYQWQQNKGYPTPAHIAALKEHGICCWHRRSFLGKILQGKLFEQI